MKPVVSFGTPARLATGQVTRVPVGTSRPQPNAAGMEDRNVGSVERRLSVWSRLPITETGEEFVTAGTATAKRERRWRQ
jgi:hypothetical protein